ncbi:MAG: T9SS type A sorting domain-containing protein [Candidatus Aegiribacteria sp.]|nr:T9SS type A sorting domain-containing protein [Candidatus Aegiribacteria sp.]MBD3294883.1 T9SS type A sorting domain-containing protein [Candidatus Fermentibacteria bacterium]
MRNVILPLLLISCCALCWDAWGPGGGSLDLFTQGGSFISPLSNPSSGNTVLLLSGEISGAVAVYDAAGRLRATVIPGADGTVTIQSLQCGMYFAKVGDDGPVCRFVIVE